MAPIRADLARDDISEDFRASNAVQRFSGGTYTVTEHQARQILDAARKTVCAE